MLRAQRFVFLLWAFSCCTAAPGHPTTLLRYDYEHLARECPYRMRVVDAGDYAGVGQAIAIPAGAKDVCGVRFKVSRAGSPGRLLWTLGRTPGGARIASGAVPADEIIPLYDLSYGGDFPPQQVAPGEKLYLRLRAEQGQYPEDYYLVYGPRPGQGNPKEAEEEGFDASGGKAFPLSFRLLTSIGPGDPADSEERFEFVRRITAPPYANVERLRDPDRKVRPGEIAVDSDWIVVAPCEGNEVIDTAVEDLRLFLARSMGVDVTVARETLSAQVLERKKAIVVADASTLPDLAGGLKSPESYRVKVDAGRIILCGVDDRGAMRAVYHLEEVMSHALAPVVKKQDTTRTCLFSPRLTQRVGPSNTFLSELSQPNVYTDGYLWRISHQGFNAIYLYGNLEELTYDSRVFPELNNVLALRKYDADSVFPEVKDERATERRYRRLAELVRRAAKYGIDVYLYYATNYHHSVPESFYERYPDCQGCSWGNSMCTSSPKVLEYFDETTRHLFGRVPGLKGLVIIFDSEGFFTCVNQRHRCPRCSKRRPEDIAAEFVNVIHKAMKACRSDSELIAWAYYTGHPKWVIDAIPKLDKGITYQGGFAKGAIVECDGIRHVTGDYQITKIGPPEHFVKQAEAAAARGLKLSAKTEHSYSQEFVNVPYIPIPFQFHRRVMAIREYPVRGLFGNWTHYGYAPNPNAEVLMWYSWDNEPEIEELLLDLARRDFGAEAAPAFVEAWRRFSEAIQLYPYSDPVARYPGPIQVGPGHPLHLDRTKPGGGRIRDWQNDLNWTEPWGPAVTLKYFGMLEAEWRRGIDAMNRALAHVPPEKREAARREFGVARSLLCCVRSCMNLTRFLLARERLYAEPDKTERDGILDEMRTIAESELANAGEALSLCRFDSRIGYASGGARVGGLYTPALIRWKLDQVEKMIRDEMPRFAATYQPPPPVERRVGAETSR